MTRILMSERQKPKSGTVRSMVVFLHGYGANGLDLLGLAEPISEHLPNTVFVAPDAPEEIVGMSSAFQWFPIPWMDGSSEEAAEQGLLASANDLNAFLDALMEEEDLSPEQVALFGFSQGTMMALHVAPRRSTPVAGVVGFSGRLVAGELLSDEVASRMPILLAHGDVDDVVPPDSMLEATQALHAAGFRKVFSHVMKGVGHGIAPDGLGVALAFLRDELRF